MLVEDCPVCLMDARYEREQGSKRVKMQCANCKSFISVKEELLSTLKDAKKRTAMVVLDNFQKTGEICFVCRQEHICTKPTRFKRAKFLQFSCKSCKMFGRVPNRLKKLVKIWCYEEM